MQQAQKKESFGEHVFNWGTYTGIGFGLNLGLSVLITDYFTHGHGTQLLRSSSLSTAHVLERTLGLQAGKLENAAHGFFKTNALMSGGHIVMAPIKWLEDHKRHVVHWLNRAAGVDAPISKDGAPTSVFSLAESDLPPLYQDQPKQSWLNVIKRRAMGLAVTSATGTALGADRMHAVENFLTDKAIMPALRKTPLAPITYNERAQRYIRLVSLDQFFTAITSGVTYVTNGANHKTEESFVEKLQAESQANNGMSLSA